MRRLLVVCLLTALLVPMYGSVGTAKAETRVQRTVETTYAPPYTPPVTGCHEVLGSWACLIIQTKPTESFFTAEVTDAHGQPVYFHVWAGYQGSYLETVGTFCGRTTKPIAIRPGASLEFDVGFPRWPPAMIAVQCPANVIKTTGTLRVTLSNVR